MTRQMRICSRLYDTATPTPPPSTPPSGDVVLTATQVAMTTFPSRLLQLQAVVPGKEEIAIVAVDVSSPPHQIPMEVGSEAEQSQ